jgi:hypothetical protein
MQLTVVQEPAATLPPWLLALVITALVFFVVRQFDLSLCLFPTRERERERGERERKRGAKR